MSRTANEAEPTAEDIERSGRCLDVASGLAANTIAAYESRLAKLDDWLNSRTLGDETLALYLAWLYAKGLRFSTANQTVCAVKWRALTAGERSPVGPATRRRLIGYRREDARKGRDQVTGLGWKQAEATCRRAEKARTARGCRDAALIGVASDALLRVSEVSALGLSDVSFMKDGSARVTIRWSKTDRDGAGAVQFVGPTNAARLANWIALAQLTEGPLFRPVNRSGCVRTARLGPGSVRAVIVHWGMVAGWSGRISGHSLRVGSAQSLAEHGAGLAQIMKDGRWKTAAVAAQYLASQSASASGTARLRHGRHPLGEESRKKRLQGWGAEC